jgi:hypothetical protein
MTTITAERAHELLSAMRPPGITDVDGWAEAAQTVLTAWQSGTRSTHALLNPMLPRLCAESKRLQEATLSVLNKEGQFDLDATTVVRQWLRILWDHEPVPGRHLMVPPDNARPPVQWRVIEGKRNDTFGSAASWLVPGLLVTFEQSFSDGDDEVYVTDADGRTAYISADCLELAEDTSTIESLKALLENTKKQAESYRVTLETAWQSIGGLLNDEAEDRDWCEQYVEFQDNTDAIVSRHVQAELTRRSLPILTIPELPRLEKEYEVSAEYSIEVTVRLSPSVTATSQNQAEEDIENSDQDHIDTDDVIGAVQEGAWEVTNIRAL